MPKEPPVELGPHQWFSGAPISVGAEDRRHVTRGCEGRATRRGTILGTSRSGSELSLLGDIRQDRTH